MVGICDGLTRSVGKKSLSMQREAGMFLWDEYAPKVAELIQIYFDMVELIQIYCDKTAVSMSLSVLMLMVHLLKLLNWLMLGGCFGFLPSASIVYMSYISPDQIVPRTCMCLKSYLSEGLIRGYCSCAPDPSP